MVFARPTADNSTQVHLFHPHMPLTLNHLRCLRNTLRPSVTHLLPLRVLYCHLLISASSPLIPRDRYLSLTMDNTIHTMTPTTHTIRPPHYFFSISSSTHRRDSRISYTPSTVNPTPTPLSAQRITITTSLPSPSPPLNDIDDNT